MLMPVIPSVATIKKSKLGKDHAVAASGNLANEETFTVDHPIWSKEEADALAKARLRDLNLTFITGEAEMAGNPDVEMVKSIEIEANAQGGSDPLNDTAMTEVCETLARMFEAIYVSNA